VPIIRHRFAASRRGVSGPSSPFRSHRHAGRQPPAIIGAPGRRPP